MPKNRIGAFADGIFAFADTLMVIAFIPFPTRLLALYIKQGRRGGRRARLRIHLLEGLVFGARS